MSHSIRERALQDAADAVVSAFPGLGAPAAREIATLVLDSADLAARGYVTPDQAVLEELASLPGEVAAAAREAAQSCAADTAVALYYYLAGGGDGEAQLTEVSRIAGAGVAKGTQAVDSIATESVDVATVTEVVALPAGRAE